MRYTMNITGMHCKGCCGLIKMSIEEDAVFSDIEVDIKSHTATFTAKTAELSELAAILQQVFAGLPGYSFNNLHITN